MKRLFLPILLLALAMPAAAQEKPPEEDPGPIVNGARHLVIEFLDLDADQADAWEVLWTDHRAAEEPLRHEIADIQAMIEDLFAAGAPDPTELGLLMIDRRALGEALVDVHTIYVEGFELPPRRGAGATPARDPGRGSDPELHSRLQGIRSRQALR